MRLDLGGGPWVPVRDGDPDALALYERHYSARRYRDGRMRRLFVGPGEKIVLVTPALDALFVWRRFRSMDQLAVGVNCAVFRNEGRVRSSDMIRSAERFARERWPGEDFYTYVDPDKVASTNPGYCFIRAGWTRERRRTVVRRLVVLTKSSREPAGGAA